MRAPLILKDPVTGAYRVSIFVDDLVIVIKIFDLDVPDLHSMKIFVGEDNFDKVRVFWNTKQEIRDVFERMNILEKAQEIWQVVFTKLFKVIDQYER
jgi:hypothetical protein